MLRQRDRALVWFVAINYILQGPHKFIQILLRSLRFVYSAILFIFASIKHICIYNGKDKGFLQLAS